MINYIISKTIKYVPASITYAFAKRYIAGVTVEDAIKTIKNLNSNNIMATIDILGEHTKIKEDSVAIANEYMGILDIIKREGLNSNVSIKPTHFGVAIDKELAFENIKNVIKKAKEINNFVRIDMEDSPYTDVTLELYTSLNKEFPEFVGTVLQAYMRRTVKDVDRLGAEKHINIRLCKGVYNEPRKIAYKDRYIINQSYTYNLEELFKKNAYVGIATHDEKIVFEAFKLIRKYGLKKEDYEFQMLLGVDEELRHIILNEGHRLRIYVPYGKEWLAYCRRRIGENPDIARMALKQILKI